MKNQKQGFIIPLVLIIAVLIAVGGFYFYKNNSNKSSLTEAQNSLGRVYTDESGLYSFSYPDNWIMGKTEKGVAFSDLGKIEPVGYTENLTYFDHEFNVFLVDKDPVIEAKASFKYLNRPYVEEEITIGRIIGKKIAYKEGIAESAQYIFPMSDGKFLLVSVVARDGLKTWLADGYKVVQTMVIQKDGILPAKDTSNDDTLDHKLKELIGDTRKSAELYRMISQSDYTGFCNSQEQVATRTFEEIAETSKGLPFKCTDGESFAVSSQLYSGKYFCADSTGFSGLTGSLHSLTYCDNKLESNKTVNPTDGTIKPF